MSYRYALYLLPLVLFVGFISGCATLSKNECLTANWRNIGYEDGVKGYSQSRMGDHRRACAEHGITLNREDYLNGRAEGLRVFCQPIRGFRYGRQGSNYRGVCPHDLEAAFLDAYNYGRNIYGTGKTLKHKQDEYAEIERHIQALDEEIAKTEHAMLNAKSKTVREKLYHEIKHKNEEKEQLVHQLGYLNEEIHRLQHDYNSLLQRSPYR